MKVCIVVMGGAADRPHDGLRGETPLARARTTHLDALLATGRQGRLRSIPRGRGPGPITALASILGYRPEEIPAAGPLEALGLGRELRSDEIAFLADFVTIRDGELADPVGGRPREVEASVLRDAVHAALGGEGRLLPGSRTYRNILLVSTAENGGASRTPPHRASGTPVRLHAPEGPGAARTIEFERRAALALAEHEVNAIRVDLHENPITGLWTWGGGALPSLEPASERSGARMVMVAGAGWPRGLGLAAGMEVEDSGPGDGAAASRALAAFDAGADVVFIHADAAWEASMDGDPGRKVEEIERIDSGILGPLRAGLLARGPHRVVVTVDCGASSTDRCSLSDPVPFVLAGEGVPASRRAPRMTELAAAAADLEVEVPTDFLPYVMG